MTADVAASVGSAAARAVHGHTAGADLVVVGSPAVSGVEGALDDVIGRGRRCRVEGEPAARLALLGRAAAADLSVPLVVLTADLDVSLPALLDLLDRPGVGTAALVADPLAIVAGAPTAARVGRDGDLIESVGGPAHEVSLPTHALPGILRVSSGDRLRAAELWRAAASSSTPGWGDDTPALAVLALVRGGVHVKASHLGPFDWSRGEVRARGASGDAWQQRLRGASRGGDGFFSTYAVRPVSRRLTSVGLRLGWTPNAVTLTSLCLGIVAALLVATGWWWAWVVAAVVLLAALVVDCVDGEIARFTRRFSALGAFLDAVGDRVKEYAVLAAVAAVGVREGASAWPLATVAMAAVTLRHLEDYAYEHRLGWSRRSRPDLLPVEAPRDLGQPGSRSSLPGRPATRTVVVHWVKKVVHMPIAERYLLIALTLLTRRPMLVLWTLFVAVLAAVVWTQGGRVAAVLLRRDDTWASVPRQPGRSHLGEQLDLGPVARVASRLGHATFAVGLLGVLVLGGGTALSLCWHHAGTGLVLALGGALLVGVGWQAPLHDRLAWQAPAALWVVEVLVVLVLVHQTMFVTTAAGFAYLAAVAFHRYDVVYRLRDTGSGPGQWLSVAALGTDGRIVVLLAVALVRPHAVPVVLWVGAVLLATLYVGESALAWRGWIRAQALRAAEV